MVQPISPRAAERPIRQRTLVMELIGPAGVGKTTLMQALTEADPAILVGLNFPRAVYLWFVAAIFFELWPAYVSYRPRGRWFTREELRAMVYLKAWRFILEQRPLAHDATILFDHGPIYRLARLREFGPAFVTSPIYEHWWNTTLAQWASLLDFGITLDAPDATLVERIQARQRWHLVKDKPEVESYEFLRRYRQILRQIISTMTVHNPLTRLEFNTASATPHQIAEQVMMALAQARHRESI